MTTANKSIENSGRRSACSRPCAARWTPGVALAVAALVGISGCSGAGGGDGSGLTDTSQNSVSAATSDSSSDTPTDDASVGQPTVTQSPEADQPSNTDQGSGGGSDNGSGSGSDTGSGLGDYRGEATVTLATYDYCGGQLGGDREQIGTRTYTTQGELILGAPQSDGTTAESNPFHLALFLGGSGADGSFVLESSEVYQVGGSTLLQYWDLSGDVSSFSGQLDQTHLPEAAAINQYWGIKLLVACRPDLGTMPATPDAIDAGASLSGQADGSGADLRFSGATTDGLYSFSVEFQS